MYHYTAFGLRIASAFEFPELLAAEDTTDPDVHICRGTAPKSLGDEEEVSPGLWINPTQYLIQIEKSGYFYAEKGNRIVVEPLTEADPKSLRIYLLCNAMPAIVHQRGFIPLHASGIVANGGVALIIGDSGAGKSTTIKALTKRGHAIFTDDVCVTRIKNNTVEGMPSYPVMKLWDSSFQLLNLASAKEEDRLWQDVEKYGLSFHNDFVSQWLPLTKVFILEKAEEASDVRMEKQKGVEAFTALGSNTYRGWYVEPMGLNGIHFQVVSKLMAQCEVVKITRPSVGDTLVEVVKMIEGAL
jgi:hypothetical protein